MLICQTSDKKDWDWKKSINDDIVCNKYSLSNLLSNRVLFLSKISLLIFSYVKSKTNHWLFTIFCQEWIGYLLFWQESSDYLLFWQEWIIDYLLFWQEWRRKLKRKDSISLRRALPCSTFLPSDKVGKIWDQQDHLFQTDETQTGMNELVLRKQSSVVLGLGGARFSLK